jgi:hypothetical protein
VETKINDDYAIVERFAKRIGVWELWQKEFHDNKGITADASQSGIAL